MTTQEFNTRMMTHQSTLKYYALSLTRNEEEAKDLVQETFFKVLSNREKYRNDTNFKAWMFTILKNTFINNYNKLSSQKTIHDDSEDEYLIRNTQVDDITPDSEFGASEIYRVLNNLEDEYRIPFQNFLNGYKYHEIAEQMNLPIGTIKSRIYFARKKLTEKLIDFR
jgi:RNA polymerase sigma-70 factor (ECF subfamily)